MRLAFGLHLGLWPPVGLPGAGGPTSGVGRSHVDRLTLSGGGLGPCLCGPLSRLRECPRDMVDGFVPVSDPKKQSGSSLAFYDQPRKSDTLTAAVLCYTQPSPDSLWEEITPGGEYQETRLTEGCLES